MQANFVQCTICIKWIHKQCSGDLSLVGFRCKRFDVTIQELDLAGGPSGRWRDIWMCKELLLFGIHP